MHTWHSKPLGNSCYICTPNTLHFIECVCNLVDYYYTYVSVPYQNICILIRLTWNLFLKHATHHHAMYSLILFSWVSLPARLQPQDLLTRLDTESVRPNEQLRNLILTFSKCFSCTFYLIIHLINPIHFF